MSRNAGALLNLTAYQGVTFKHTLIWHQPDLADLDTNGDPKLKPVDLTGYTAVLTISKAKKSSADTQLLRLTTNVNGGLTLDGDDGKLDVEITDTQVDAQVLGRYYWDAIVIAPDSTVYKWPQSGRFSFKPAISRSVAPT